MADLLALSSGLGDVRAVPTEPQANSRGNQEMREADAKALFTAVRTDAPLPAADQAAATAAAPADVTADVLNASGRDGLAAEVAGTLGDLGFRTAEVKNAGQPALDTVVRFSPDRAEQARLLAGAVPSANPVPDPGSTGVLQLVLGRSFDGTVRAATAPEPVADTADRTRRDLRLIVRDRSPPVHPPLPLRPVDKNYARPMRDVYQEQLTGLADALADMCQQTAVAMEHATRALLRGRPAARRAGDRRRRPASTSCASRPRRRRSACSRCRRRWPRTCGW